MVNCALYPSRWLARREAWERVVTEYRQQLAESCQKTKGFSCGRAYALLKQARVFVLSAL